MIGRKLLATLAVAAVACLSPLAAGAQTTAPPKQWTATFCTSLVKWQKSVQVNAGELEKTLTGLKKTGDLDMRSTRGEFVTFLDRLAQSTAQLRASLHATGAPAVPHGPEIQQQLESGFGKLAARFRSIAVGARSLPLGNVDVFVERADAIGTSISKATDGLGATMSALDKYDAGALESAAKSVPACKALN
jgi:hypothetical protein